MDQDVLVDEPIPHRSVVRPGERSAVDDASEVDERPGRPQHPDAIDLRAVLGRQVLGRVDRRSDASHLATFAARRDGTAGSMRNRRTGATPLRSARTPSTARRRRASARGGVRATTSPCPEGVKDLVGSDLMEPPLPHPMSETVIGHPDGVGLGPAERAVLAIRDLDDVAVCSRHGQFRYRRPLLSTGSTPRQACERSWAYSP